MITILVSDEPIELSWEQWEERVGTGRIPPGTMVRFEPVTGTEFARADSLEAYLSLLNNPVSQWKDIFRNGPPPLMCAILVGVQIRIWWLLSTSGEYYAMDWGFLMAHAIYEDGEVWRLLSMGFIQLEFGHLASNMAVMFFVGWNLERALGHWNLLTIFSGSVIGGSLLSIWMSPESISIGSSGGVFGLVAAGTIFGFAHNDMLPPKARRVFGWALFPYVLGMFGTGWLDENVDNWAHLGGLLSGIVIALLIAPPSISSQSWRRFTPYGVFAASIVVGFALWMLGSQILPIEATSPVHRQMQGVGQAEARLPHRPLIWSAPIGWERLQGPQGLSLYVSPQSDDRAWGVRVRKDAQPKRLNEYFDEWTEYLAEKGATPAENQAIESSPIGDTNIFEMRYMQPGSKNKHIFLRVGTQGLYVYEEIWQVYEDEVSRLSPLRTRLQATVRWTEPSSYLDARREHKLRPEHYKKKARYAMAQLEWGQPKRAVKAFEELIASNPVRPEGWTGLIHAANWYPDDTSTLDTLTQMIFDHEPQPQILAELASAYKFHGKLVRSQTISDAAWERFPGDRSLRRQRDQFGLSTALHEGTPRYLFWTPNTGTPRTAPVKPLTHMTLDELESRESKIRTKNIALKSWIKEALFADPLSSTSRFIFAATGDIPTSNDLLEAIELISDELGRIQFGAKPAWMDDEMVHWVREIQAKHAAWLQDMTRIGAALHIQRNPTELGKTVGSGMGPKDLLENEQIQFLSTQPRSTLLLKIGFKPYRNGDGSLSDLALATPP